ncbi:SIS domain-containing protein [Actinospica robiniae]|uniref:SIS domain-containing protein n=1 Tax=Actinospica robiniae TaxID=304901 RepID=UPI00146FC4CC|nr:SIS domain-containing protein [Actinospica robiniae]
MTAPGSSTARAGRHIRGEMREQPDVLGNLARHVTHFAEQAGVLSAQAGGFDEVVFLADARDEHAAMLGRHAVEARCGIAARVLTPVEPADPAIASEDAGDRRRLAVVLSPSGSEPGVLALASHYAEAGATLIAVTNDVRSPLAMSAALCIDLAAGLELAASPTKSTTGLMLALLAIVEGLPATSDTAQTSKAVLGNAQSAKALAQLVAELLADTAPAEAAAARLVAARRIAVVGCDYLVPAALETARMLRDTAGLAVEGFSADGFRTGPVGGFDTETTAVLLAGDGGCDEAVAELRASLLSRNVPMVSISSLLEEPEGAAAVRVNGAPDLTFPALGSMAECILATVRGQQLAVAAAVALGVDPDRGRTLANDNPQAREPLP